MGKDDNHKKEELRIDDSIYETSFTEKYRNRKTYQPDDINLVKSVIPGIIKEIAVTKGQKIIRNQKLFILEAMKMGNIILAPVDGKVKDIFVEKDQMVMKGQALLILE
jgi:biotin carboxyl carrier protein